MAIAIVLAVLIISVVLFITEVLPIDVVAVLMLLGLTLPPRSRETLARRQPPRAENNPRRL